MVVCQYFLQGRCHFGRNCRYAHVYKNSPDHKGDNRGGRRSGHNELDSAIWEISNDVIAAENGGQWPLSCFSPIKGLCLPWWEDISPEEVRWTLYEARNNGTVDQALNQINQWYKKAENARNLLKQPTADVTETLKSILKGEQPTQSDVAAVSGFASSAGDGKTTFRFDTSINKLYGNSANPTMNSGSIFGNTSSGFQNQNVVVQGGQSLSSTNTQNIFSFSEQSHQNVFSNTGSSGHNIFTGQTLNQAFPTSDMDSQKMFPNQPQTNVFTGGSPSFGVANPVSDDSKANTAIFGNTQDNISAIQNPNPSGQAETSLTKADGGASFSSTSKDVDFSTYSKMEDLTESDVKAFKSTTFAFGKIPLNSPPPEFC